MAGYAEGSVTVSEGTGAAPCDVAPCGAAPCGVSPSDTAPCDAALCGVAPCGVSSGDSAPCSAAPCKAQGTAAEVESEVEGDGEAAFLAASVAGGMSGRVSGRDVAMVGVGSAVGSAISSSAAQRAAREEMLRAGSEGGRASEQGFSAREMSEDISSLVLAGAGDDGGPASSRVRFMPDRADGTGMEAAVAWRNSANASSRILTRVSMVARVLWITRRASSTRDVHGRSVGVAADAHGEGAGPKVCGPPLALYWGGLDVPEVPRSQDSAAPA